MIRITNKLRLSQSRLFMANYRNFFSFVFKKERVLSKMPTIGRISNMLIKNNFCATKNNAQPPIPNQAEQVLESALQILLTGGPNNEPPPFSLELLPKSPDSTVWTKLKKDYGLSIAQKLALQNYVSASPMIATSSPFPLLTPQQKHDRAIIESYFGSSNSEGSNLICGDHIVAEFFEYIPREADAEKIVCFMRERQALRSGGSAPKDRANNRLIAVPGSPGSGKSTFLKHFPTSQAFKKYIGDLKISDEPAIVSLITFNGGMGGTDDALGLRILYGALAAMGYLNIADITWSKFLEQSSSLSKWTALDVVDFLQQTFGPHRTILLLVDELRESKSKEEVVQQLGLVLDHHGNCDVVVSSLSPQFVKNLMTKSRRQIEYVVLNPLLDARLGKKECLEWANIMIKYAGGAEKVDSFIQAVLRNLYLLYGGHPRALEKMIEELRKFDNWKNFDLTIVKPNALKFLLIFELLAVLPEYNSCLNGMSEEELLRYVFSTPSVFSVVDTRSRELVEDGKLLIHDLQPADQFSTYVQCISLLKLSSFNTCTTLKMGTVHELLNSFKSCNKASTFWERVVALNIITRSGTDSIFTCTVGGLLGIRSIEEDFISKWNFKVEKQEDYDPKSLHDCLVLPSDENQPGNEGSLYLVNKYLNNRLRFFLQIKISAPDELLNVVTSMICHNILEGMRDGTLKLANTHMILYIWNMSDKNFELVDQGKNTVLSKVTKMIKTITDEAANNKRNIPVGFDDNVRSFIINYYGSNIHAIKGSSLRIWLSPSLLPLPLFFTEIEKS